MIIELVAQRRDDPAMISAFGDVLEVNGVRMDFGGLPDGARIGDGKTPSSFILGGVSRAGGVLSVRVAKPVLDWQDSAQWESESIYDASGVILDQLEGDNPGWMESTWVAGPEDWETEEQSTRRAWLESIPRAISRRQFFQVLAVRGLITRVEAIAALTYGVIPQALQDLIDLFAVDEDLEFDAKMLIIGAQEFERSNWIVDAIGSIWGMDSDQISQLWIDAYRLT